MKFLFTCLAILFVGTPAWSAALPTQPADFVERAVRMKSPRWKFVAMQRMRELPETFALQVTAAASLAA